MQDTDRLLIENACQRLVTAYCHHVDHGEAARIADLFSDDGVWFGGGARMEGRAALEKGFQARQDQAERMSRHVCQNFLCTVIDEDNAEGVVYLTLYRHDGDPERKFSPLEGPELIGEYRDKFVRTHQGWRMSSREIVVSFMRGAE